MTLAKLQQGAHGLVYPASWLLVGAIPIYRLLPASNEFFVRAAAMPQARAIVPDHVVIENQKPDAVLHYEDR